MEEQKNQCDGCQRKLEIKDGFHYKGKNIVMGCTADRYTPEERHWCSDACDKCRGTGCKTCKGKECDHERISSPDSTDVDEVIKNCMYSKDIDFSMSLEDDSVIYQKSYQLFGKIKKALIRTASQEYKRGKQEMAEALIIKADWGNQDMIRDVCNEYIKSRAKELGVSLTESGRKEVER